MRCYPCNLINIHVTCLDYLTGQLKKKKKKKVNSHPISNRLEKILLNWFK